jgi:hypothetical protein
MIAAGLRELMHYNPRETSDVEDAEIVTSIFQAMYRRALVLSNQGRPTR